MNNEINGKGFVAGLISWLLICYFAIQSASCMKFGKTCGGFEMLILMILGIGFLAPAYLIATIVSDLTKK